jgi:hypothetical protein
VPLTTTQFILEEAIMTRPVFRALPTEIARSYQAGGPDAHGRPPEHLVAGDSPPGPCRHCMTLVQPAEEYLVLAHRPFSALQPYAESGPIFLHARPCERHPDSQGAPAGLMRSSQVIVRGYSAAERIIYGTGALVAPDRVAETAARILDRPDVAFVHVRYAATNCYACRIDIDRG